MREQFNRFLILFMLIFTFTFYAQSAEKKKVLFIDSYHAGYAWSDGIENGVKKVLADKVDLKVIHMDTKKNPGEEFKQKAALEAKKVIDDWKPDVVIAADDNASKYIIAKYYMKSKIPFVFCGLNWDCSVYGFPTDNICGMEEVPLFKQLITELKKMAKGDKIGYIGPNTMTTRKEAENMTKKFGIQLNSYFAKDFEDWKKGFVQLQQDCDIVIVGSDGGLYDKDKVTTFAEALTKKPTGSFYDFTAPWAMVSYAKLATEQGEWAGAAALKILDGKTPKEIGVTQNKEAQIFVNMKIAKKVGADIPFELIEDAQIIK